MTDQASRLTPVSATVLALLTEGDMHPYEMARLLRIRRDDGMVKVTNGSLYHAVARLLEQGLVAEVGTDRDGNRPERTTYTLLPAGADAVIAWVRDELPRADHPVPFRVALAEAHNLSRVEVIDLLRSRSAALEGDIASHADGLAGARASGVPAQFLIEIERRHALLEADLAWQRTLVARLEADEIPWGPEGFDDTDRYTAQREAARE